MDNSHLISPFLSLKMHLTSFCQESLISQLKTPDWQPEDYLWLFTSFREREKSFGRFPSELLREYSSYYNKFGPNVQNEKWYYDKYLMTLHLAFKSQAFPCTPMKLEKGHFTITSIYVLFFAYMLILGRERKIYVNLRRIRT